MSSELDTYTPNSSPCNCHMLAGFPGTVESSASLTYLQDVIDLDLPLFAIETPLSGLLVPLSRFSW
jgi:hypothetical protein